MKIFSSTLYGVKPVLVEIEIDLSNGLPFFQIVGLPDEVLRESKTRVKSAILQAGFAFPYDKRVVLNLAPSQLKKEGSAFELALASKIIFEAGQGIKPPFENILMLGELGLNGNVKSVDRLSSLLFTPFLTSQKIDLIVIPDSEDIRIYKKFSCPVVTIKNLSDLIETAWWEKKVSKNIFDVKSEFQFK
jgi:magnesium chelatase family protein